MAAQKNTATDKTLLKKAAALWKAGKIDPQIARELKVTPNKLRPYMLKIRALAGTKMKDEASAARFRAWHAEGESLTQTRLRYRLTQEEFDRIAGNTIPGLAVYEEDVQRVIASIKETDDYGKTRTDLGMTGFHVVNALRGACGAGLIEASDALIRSTHWHLADRSRCRDVLNISEERLAQVVRNKKSPQGCGARRGTIAASDDMQGSVIREDGQPDVVFAKERRASYASTPLEIRNPIAMDALWSGRLAKYRPRHITTITENAE